MPDDKMYCVITLRKEVPDAAAGRVLYDLVKLRLVDHPEVDIKGQVANHFIDDEEPD